MKTTSLRMSLRVRKGLIAATSVVLTAVMCSGFLTKPSDSAYAADITDTPESIVSDASPRVPVVESKIHRGSVSSPSEAAITLPGVKSDSAALLRVSIFNAAKDADISVSGTPALHVAKGHDASTSVLAKVSDGKVSIGSNTPLDARIEVLAVFDSNPSVAGSTVALKTPITRVDSTKKLGVVAADHLSEKFGVVGLGDVPAQDVRAVYTTLSVDAKTAGNVVLGGQQLAIPAGQSVISTIVVPDSDGNVSIDADAPLTNVRVDVRGYVAGATQNAQYANVRGSYVPVSGSTWQSTSASEKSQGSVSLPEVAGSDLGIALVSGSVTTWSNESAHTFVDVGKVIEGRSSGVLLDKTAGAQPQLEVVEDAEGAAPLSVRGSRVETHTLLLGDILGDKPTGKSVLNVAISSPKQNDRLDFGKTGGIQITGTVHSQSVIEAVNIYGDGSKIGTASLRYAADGGEWKFTGASPHSGQVEYEAEAVSRDGTTAKADLNVNVVLPSDDATVIDPDVVVIDAKNSPVTATDSQSVTLNRAPNFAVGKIIVSDVSKHAPQGFLRWVDSIQRVGNQWKVTTHQATLTDAIIQGHSSSADSTSDAEVAQLSDPQTQPSEPITVLDGPEKSVKVLHPAASSSSNRAISYSANTNTVTPLAYKAASASSDTSDGWVDSDPRDVKIGTTASFDKKYAIGDGAGTATGVEGSAEAGDYTATSGVEISKTSDSDGKKIAKDVTLHGGVVFGVNLSGEIGIQFGIQIKVKWDWDFTNDIDYLKAEAYDSFETKLSLEAGGSVKWAPSIPLAKLQQGHTFDIGIPIYVSAEADINLEPSVEVGGKLTWNTDVQLEHQAGAQHHEGTSPYFEGYVHTRQTPKEDTPCWDKGFGAEFSVKRDVGISFAPKIMVYDALGPGIEVTPSIGIENTVAVNDSGKVTASTDAHASISGKMTFDMRVPIIDKKLAHWESGELKSEVSLGLEKETTLDMCKPDSDSGEGGGSSGSDTSKDVTVAWTDPKSGKTHSETVSSGTQYEVTQSKLEAKLGLASGALNGMKGVSTQASGKGNIIRLGHVFQANSDTTLNVFYTDPKLPGVDATRTDIVFVIDSTGSMRDEIDSVRENVEKLADAIDSASKDYRIALVDYKDAPDQGDPYQSRTDVDFTTDVPKFKQGVETIDANGGGDTPESVYSGINTALDLKWRDGVRKSVFLIGDAPGKDPEPVTGLTQTSIIDKAKEKGVELYPLGRVYSYDSASESSYTTPGTLTDSLLKTDKADTRTLLTADAGTAVEAADDTDDDPAVDTSSFEGFTWDLAKDTGGTYTEYTSEDFVTKLLDIVVKATRAPDVCIEVGNTFYTGDSVNLDVSTNADPDDPVVSYDWNFGTGKPSGEYDATTKEPTVSTVFSKAGTYTINVTAHTKSGINGTGKLTVVVKDKVPTTTFSGTVTVTHSQAVTFSLPVIPGTEEYGALTFDNGSATKTVPGEGVWTISRDGNFINAQFAPVAGYQGSKPQPQTYLLSDAAGHTVNGRITAVFSE